MGISAITVLFWFSAGMIIQVAVELRERDEFIFLGAAVLIAAIASMIPVRGEIFSDIAVFSRLITFFILFVPVCFLMFRNKLMPHINQQITAVNTMMLWFVLLYLVHDAWRYILISLAAPVSVLVLYGVFVRGNMSAFMKTVLYFWNQIVYVTMFAVQYRLATDLYATMVQMNGWTVIRLITTGMVFFTIGYSLIGLVYLLPFRAEGQSWDERRNDIREYLAGVVQRFRREDVSPFMILVLITGTFAILVVNHIYGLFSDFMLISILLLGVRPVTRRCQDTSRSGVPVPNQS